MPAATLAGALALAGCGGGDTITTAKDLTPDERDRLKRQMVAADCAKKGKLYDADENDCADKPVDPTVKDRTDTAKALKGAFDQDGDLSVGATTTLTKTGGEQDDFPQITLKKQAAMVDALGGWNGADYKGENGSGATKQTGMARLYSNQGSGDPISFAQFAVGDGGLSGTPNGEGAYPITPANTGTNVGGTAFPKRGQETYTGADRKFDGTYNGVSGEYQCTGSNACTAGFRSEEGILLAGTWTFKPIAGATVRKGDADYLYFGWWVRKDKDDKPTHSRAVYGKAGTLSPLTDSVIDNTALQGPATYTGKAAGKFAVSDPLDAAKDDSGHFTADAMLTADFKAGGSTLEGTIDEFRLNDGATDPGWTVKLKEAMFDAGDDIWESSPSDGTEWHIGEAKGDASGSWEAQMYAGDDKGNNTPGHVVGAFHSEIGSTHEVHGAFGAELD